MIGLEDIPETLRTYSSYLNTASAIYWLHDNDVDPSLSVLSEHLGKNKTTISDQVKGHLSTCNIITYEKEGSRIKIKPNPEGLTSFWFVIVRYELKGRQGQMKSLRKSLEYQDDGHLMSLGKTELDLDMLADFNELSDNEVVQRIISHSLKRYGRSVTTQKGMNRGHISNLLEWSFNDFCVYLAKEGDIFVANLPLENEEDQQAHDLFVELREIIRNPMERFFLHEAVSTFNFD